MPKKEVAQVDRFTPSQLTQLRDPRISTRLFGQVLEQEGDASVGHDRLVPFDPYAISHKLQATTLSYMAAPPRDELGQTKWLVELGPRQVGKSTVGEIAAYPLAAYTPGFDHVCYCDVRSRAEYLHSRVQILHTNWPEDIRIESEFVKETRQLTFDRRYGGKMRTKSLEESAAGIGQSPNSFHWSEVGFANDAGSFWSLTFPSMGNKKNVRVLLECTPTTAQEMSTEFWKTTCYDAKKGDGRWIYAFFPFWDGKINARPWPKGDKPDLEELRLLEKHEKNGMKLENLAFRRYTMAMDAKIRRNPELFDVFFPSNDVDCWSGAIRGVIRRDLVEKQRKRVLVPWNGPYMEYASPKAGAVYIIGSDPTGYGARDHAAAQVLEVWEDRWEQVACYALNIGDPEAYARELVRIAERYNNAMIVVESNGVGAGTLTALSMIGYRNVFHQTFGKPGYASTGKSVQEGLGWLTDALMDELCLNDDDTVDQLGSYKNDKLIEDQPRTEMLRDGKPLKGRRPRHHWDKVSALIMAVVGARYAPRRRRIETPPDDLRTGRAFDDMSYAEQRAYWKKANADKAALAGRAGIGYRSVRRRR